MARMLPSVPSAHTVSDAERFMFRRFRDDCPSDWTVLHSLGISGHARKPWAEADFVVVAPQGILVLEVKGGHVARRGRRWYTNDAPLKESPFEQAAGAAAALANDLHAAVPATRRATIGHAVAFPDVRFRVDGPDIDTEIIFDDREIGSSLSDWVISVFHYWRIRLESGGRAERPGLSREAMTNVLDRLAGDFDLQPSIGAKLGIVEDELVRFTDDQKRVLDALSENPRMIIDGGAGTGKTWLALEEAVRSARSGRTVLLTCHSRALAAHLGGMTRDEARIHVEHFHGMTTRLIRDAGLELPDAAPQALFGRFHPELALEALARLEEPWLFDVLIVDETQDLLGESALDLLDALVLHGISSGVWRFFRDPWQDVFSAAALGALERFPDAQPTRLRLTVNCRNTAEIALQTAIVSNRVVAETLPVSGPPVEYFSFADSQEQLRSVAAIILRWLDGGVMPAEIVILSLRRLEHTPLYEGLPKGVPATLRDIGEGGRVTPKDREIRFSTVAGFKGLEARAVLFLDVGDLSRTDNTADLYVGLSRARSLLAVGVATDQKQHFDERGREYGRRLVAVSARDA